MRQRLSIVVIAGIVALSGTFVAASGPIYWTLASASDFLKGTSDGVYVSLSGVITAGPPLVNRLTTSPAQIWSLATAPDGTLWAGTGGDGRVIRIRPGQPEETVFTSGENDVFALAISGTRVFAATGPDGKVYVIESDGTAHPFFDPPEKYIWALAVDGQGRLWVGAGSPAVIYRVDMDGTSHVVYKPPAAHVVCLTLDQNGRMLAGTDSPGRLYRFDANDRPFVVLDSDLSELRAASVDASGVIFAASVARGDESGSSAEPGSVASATSSSGTGSSASSTGTSATASGRRSLLYRIAPDGTWEEIWSTGDVIYDVAAQADGGVLVATGPDGRLYKVDRNLDVLLLTGVDAKDIIRFSTDRTKTLTAFATANPGRVIGVGAGEQSPATYLSPVHDSKSVATWGLISWDTSAPVALYTRSGNTEIPDDSWSPWSSAYTDAGGAAVTSPASRFVQWRAVFTAPAARGAAAAALTSVTVAYLPRNSRPEVSTITTYPPGVVFQRPYASDDSAIAGLDDAVADERRPAGDTGPTTPFPTRRLFQKGLQTISWKGDDDDGDRLVYTLQYRREGDDTWRVLKTDFPDTIYVWDTTTVPDGRYIVRVTASDSPSNSVERALSGDRESDPIEVDNTPPVITTAVTRTAAGLRLEVHVHDARSPIDRLEYSVGGGPWQLVYPTTGLADSPDERYEIPIASEADAARIMLRASDILANVASIPATAGATATTPSR